MNTTARRRIAWLGGAATVAAVAPVLATMAPAQAATPVDKTFTYSCAVAVGKPGEPPLNLQGQPTQVAVKFTVPDLVQGATVPATPVDISLTLAPALHSVTISLGGKSVSGSSTDTQLQVTAGGQSENYPVSGLSVTDSPIPQNPAEDWTIPITGSSPEIPVPAVDSLELLAPARFTIQSVISGPAQGPLNADLDCAAPADRSLATISVDDGQVDPTPDPTDDPTPDPTDDPTTDPTDDPTDEPTVAPTDGSGPLPSTGPGTGVGGTGNGLQPAASNDALPNTGAAGQLTGIAVAALALFAGGLAVYTRRPRAARHSS